MAFESDCFVPAGTRYFVIEGEGRLSGERFMGQDEPVKSADCTDAYSTYYTEDGEFLLILNGDQ